MPITVRRHHCGCIEDQPVDVVVDAVHAAAVFVRGPSSTAVATTAKARSRVTIARFAFEVSVGEGCGSKRVRRNDGRVRERSRPDEGGGDR
jgi:hypothetical protein